MGTRHLTAVVLNGEYKVAQYGQWDGYPSGQGATVAKFVRNKERVKKFTKAVAECTFLTNKEVDARWKESGAKGNGWVTMDVSDRHKKKYPELSRDAGADILNLILEGKRQLKNDIEFSADSLFCEWAYVINLDTQEVEVYQGFNKEPLKKTDRFYGMKNVEPETRADYYPIKLVKSYPFKEFNSQAIKELEKSGEEE